MRRSVDPDVRRLLASQAIRALGYGFGSVLLASTLAESDLSTIEVGVVLGSLVGGTVIAQLIVARWADRWGRRRSYPTLYLAIGLVGLVFASGAPLWLLVGAALTGSFSVDVIESGPFTSLELSMLAGRLDPDALTKGFGWYNALAAAAGSLGALIAALPELARTIWPSAPADRAWFLLFVPIAASGMVIAGRLTSAVELADRRTESRRLGPSRPVVVRLASLFAVDAFAGGFVVQSFIAFWLIDRFDITAAAAGALFAALGVVQTASFLAAPVLARRVGLVNTMVFSHLPSNLLLAAVAFAPSFPIAAVLLLARASLSQMDVPTRQAFVLTLVGPEERTAAIAYTNTARYLVRPIGPVVAAAAFSVTAGAPFVVAGVIKSIYDLTLWGWFRNKPLPATKEPTP